MNDSIHKEDTGGTEDEDRSPIFQTTKRATNIKYLLKEHKDAEKHKLLTIKLALKCADFSHFMRDFQVRQSYIYICFFTR